MSGAPTARRLLFISSAVTTVVAIIGFTVTLVLNIFLLDQYNAYGEVPIPGSGDVQLPAGHVTVSFHAVVTGGTSGGGLPVPPLTVSIDPPAGAAPPVVTENFGSTTTVNNDAHARVWVAEVAVNGQYHVTTNGQVGGFIEPRLAFGHQSSFGWLVWVFVALFVVGLLQGICAGWWSARSRQTKRQTVTPTAPVFPRRPADVDVSAVAAEQAAAAYAPTDEGARLEQLRTIASLRDSGVLTEVEFQSEKRIILDGR